MGEGRRKSWWEETKGTMTAGLGGAGLSHLNLISSPMMAPAQAKAVCVMCPKSVWLLPSSKMAVPTGLSAVAEGSSGWLFPWFSMAT